MPGQAVYIRYQAVCEFLHNNEEKSGQSKQAAVVMVCVPLSKRLVRQTSFA